MDAEWKKVLSLLVISMPTIALVKFLMTWGIEGQMPSVLVALAGALAGIGGGLLVAWPLYRLQQRRQARLLSRKS